MKRTTIFAEAELLDELQHIAAKEKKSTAHVVREALNEYVTKKRSRGTKLSFIASGASGRNNIADKHEELLWRKERNRSGR